MLHPPDRSWRLTQQPVRKYGSTLAVLRLAVFAFVIVDVLFLHTSGWYHGYADPVWYQALDIGRILHLPETSATTAAAVDTPCAMMSIGSSQ